MGSIGKYWKLFLNRKSSYLNEPMVCAAQFCSCRLPIKSAYLAKTTVDARIVFFREKKIKGWVGGILIFRFHLPIIMKQRGFGIFYSDALL